MGSIRVQESRSEWSGLTVSVIRRHWPSGLGPSAPRAEMSAIPSSYYSIQSSLMRICVRIIRVWISKRIDTCTYYTPRMLFACLVEVGAVVSKVLSALHAYSYAFEQVVNLIHDGCPGALKKLLHYWSSGFRKKS